MRRPSGRRNLISLALAAAAAALLIAGAQATSFGGASSKGCLTPTFVNQPMYCDYHFQNIGATSHNTLTLNSIVDTVHSGTISSGNILPDLALIGTPNTGTGAVTCTGTTSGNGSAGSPWKGATSCTLPFGSSLDSDDSFSWYSPTPADFAAAGSTVSDQVTYNWTDNCNVVSAGCVGTPQTYTNGASTQVVEYNPTITTLLSSSSITAGQSVNDTSKITYDTTPPTVSGTVTYKLFTDNACSMLSTSPALNQTVTYTGGTPPPSMSVMFPSAGNYWFQATFSGDAADGVAGPVSSDCTSEPLVVSPASPTIATTPNPASGAIGVTLKDSATLSGTSNLLGTGTITFTLFPPSDPTCAGTPVDTEMASVTAGDNGPYTTPTGFVSTTAGTYHWSASFNGDANNNGATSTCASEPVVISKASPTIATTPNPASGTVGVTLKDSATLSGTSNLLGTGTITFTLFPPSDPTCAGTPVDSETVSVTAGDNGPYTTPTGFVSTTAGTYHWESSFSGDANNNGATSTCASEPVVLKANPTIATTPNPASGNVGATLNDSATLSGTSNLLGTGTITFTLFPPSDPTCAGTPVDTETAPVTAGNNGPYTTPTGFVSTTAGTYHWSASFNGDANNNGATSTCASEPVVLKANPTIATTPNPASGTVGVTLKDSATLSGTNNLLGTGTITFTLFPPSDPTCAGTPVDTETASVTAGNNGPYTTPTGFVSTTTGTYHWAASFNGDANNNAASSTCASEPVVIGKASPTIATTPNPASGAIGVTLKDSATLSGTSNLLGTGTITFTLFPPSDPTCAGTPVDTETASVTAGNNGPYSTPTGFVSTTSGTYHWSASFNGDANNNGATSTCASEPVVISKASPTIATTANPMSGTVGVTLKDSATLSGTSNLLGTGTITFTLFPPSDPTCAGTPVDSETVSVTAGNNGPYTTPTGYVSTTAGTYHWESSFSGDANNNGATSTCASEPVVITMPGTANFTPGYWKNHQSATSHWLPLTLGNYSVSTFADAQNILSGMGCGSAGVENCMAGMLLATELNLAQGGVKLPCVVTAVSDANALLVKYHYNGAGSTPSPKLTSLDAAQMMTLHDELSNYSQDGIPTSC